MATQAMWASSRSTKKQKATAPLSSLCLAWMVFERKSNPRASSSSASRFEETILKVRPSSLGVQSASVSACSSPTGNS